MNNKVSTNSYQATSNNHQLEGISMIGNDLEGLTRQGIGLTWVIRNTEGEKSSLKSFPNLSVAVQFL